MDELYMIHLDDYVRHINDKLTLYAMLRQMEAAVAKLPESCCTFALKRRMAAWSHELDELWESWNIPACYLDTGEAADLKAVLEDELTEPEDAGYFCGDSEIHVSPYYLSDEQPDGDSADMTEKVLLTVIDGILDILLDLSEEVEQLNEACFGDEL